MRGAWRLGGLLALHTAVRVLRRVMRPAPGPPSALKESFGQGQCNGAPALSSDSRAKRAERLHDAGARLCLAALLCLVAVLLRQWAANDQPQFRASFVAVRSTQGLPISVAGVPTSAPTGRLPPPIDAEFGGLSVNRLKTGHRGTVLIDITVLPTECPRLLEKLGGTCGDRSTPAQSSGEVELSMVRAGEGMSADLWLSHPGTIELTETGALNEQGIPTGWTLDSKSSTTRVNISCSESILVISARRSQPVRCAFVGVHYVLPVSSAEDVLPSLSLTEVSTLNARLEGISASMTVDEGELSRDGEFETLASAEPLEVSLRGSDRHPVDLGVRSQNESGVFSLTMSAAMAEGIEWEEQDHTRSRLDRQPELAYALFGVIVGFILIALADFVFALFTAHRIR